MFEDYLEDASWFIQAARVASDDRGAVRMYRAAVLSSAAAAEAFVNFMADTLAYGTFDAHEIAFLQDFAFGLNNEYEFAALDRQEFHRLEEKIRLLLAKFNIPLNLSTDQTWSQFLALKNQRDRIVHPRHLEETSSRDEYDGLVARGLTTVVDLMNRLSEGVFEKPLRKKLLDLKL